MSNELSTKLSPGERDRLAYITSAIGIYSESFWGVFDLLAEVKNDKLYREDYGTFEEFCKVTLGFSRQYANRMIKARTVMIELSSENFGNESFPKSALVELSKAPPEVREEVAKAIKEKKTKPTESLVKDEVEKRTKANDDLPANEDDDETVGDEPAKPTELSNRPEDLLPQLAAARQSVTNLKKELKRLSAQTGGEWLNLELNDLSLKLDAIRHTIKGTDFAATCPKCRNDKKAKQTCVVCRTYGWIAESRVEFAKNYGAA